MSIRGLTENSRASLRCELELSAHTSMGTLGGEYAGGHGYHAHVRGLLEVESIPRVPADGGYAVQYAKLVHGITGHLAHLTATK